MINACISIIEAIIPESSSLSVNISSVTEIVSFSFYDRYDTVLQHHHHTVALVQVMTARAKTFFRSQHLPDGNTVFTKQLIVTVDQLCLPHRRESCLCSTLSNFLEGLISLRPEATAPDEIQNDFHSGFAQFRHLVYQCRHTRHIQCTVFTRQHITTYLYCYSCN